MCFFFSLSGSVATEPEDMLNTSLCPTTVVVCLAVMGLPSSQCELDRDVVHINQKELNSTRSSFNKNSAACSWHAPPV